VMTDILQRLKNLAEVQRHFENTIYADAAAEIERLREDFLQVHHNCIHARSVADKALELLAQVPMPFQSMLWRQAVHDVTELAKSVPPRAATR